MSNKKNDDEMMGCLALVILCIVALPLVGVYMLVKGDGEEKAIGGVLVIIGIILWIVLPAMGHS